MFDAFTRYLERLSRIPVSDQTEMTGRGALEELLNEAVSEFAQQTICIQHEPKRVRGSGAPDFKISSKGMTLGYVENKSVGQDLGAVIGSDQIERYRSLCPNILLTDYLDWVWISPSGLQRARLLTTEQLAEGSNGLTRESSSAVEVLLRGFFSETPQPIASAKTLAIALASRSELLRNFLHAELEKQEHAGAGGVLYGLYQVFKDQVSHEITVREFSDAFAQTLAYGLFMARLKSDQSQTITLSNAKHHIPQSYSLIQELVGFLERLEEPRYADIRWVVEEVLSIINALRISKIQNDLTYRFRKGNRSLPTQSEDEWRLFSKDPFVYFYEDYLSKYDQKMKKSRGVYYTPPPIVNFIVRAIDDLLKSQFELASGLADRKSVTVLDFACGTGTFLVEVLEQIFAHIGGPGSSKAASYVHEHILKNIYGFEYLIAPYTIAHLKLSQYLSDNGFELQKGERFQVFLTNTLEPVDPERNYLVPELSHETEAAQEVKDKPILVVTGNPPYSGHSKNKGPAARASIDEYKKVWWTDDDGNTHVLPLGEKNPKWLQDDYVKFIRFAQKKVDDAGTGVVGIITNHSFLDNPTFRGMRQSLVRSFDQILLIDLHGNAKKKERGPDGSPDVNVFDIEQGVAISLFVKRPGVEKKVVRADVYGTRLSKYQWASSTNLCSIPWTTLQPRYPMFAFSARDTRLEDEFYAGWAVPDIFPVGSVGIVTARDALLLDIDERALKSRIKRFAEMEPEKAREEFALGKDSSDWTIKNAQNDVRELLETDAQPTEVMGGPFDKRYTYYTGKSGGFHCRPRDDVMRHMLQDNVGILISRSHETQTDWSMVGAVSRPSTHHALAEKEVNYLHPLWYYSPPKPADMDLFGIVQDAFEGRERVENISKQFRDFIDTRYACSPSAEQIFGYVYGALHAPLYRRLSKQLLRTDFPRVKLPERLSDFERIAELGWALSQMQVLKAAVASPQAVWTGTGDNVVREVTYDPDRQELRINSLQKFTNVAAAAWDFEVGGYRVLDKYLRSRLERSLSLDEIEHIERLSAVLEQSTIQTSLIDTAYRNAFPSQVDLERLLEAERQLADQSD